MEALLISELVAQAANGHTSASPATSDCRHLVDAVRQDVGADYGVRP